MSSKANSRRFPLPHLSGILLCTVFCVIAAKPEMGEALETLVKKSTGKLPSASQVASMSPETLGIHKTAKEELTESYTAFLGEYSKVRKDYRQHRGVANCTAIRYVDVVAGDRVPLSTKAENEPNNSLYVAFALLTGAGVDYAQIGNREHLKVLSHSYGVTAAQIENGIWETLTRDWNEILGCVVNMIGDSVPYAGCSGNGRFMRNVIHPYMTLLSRGYTIPEDIEARVFRAFDKAFPGSDDAKGLLRTYSEVFKEYIEGGAMDGKHGIALNNRLKSFGYHMTVR